MNNDAWFFRDSYNWTLRIQKKSDTRTSIYVMFKDCVKLEENMLWHRKNVM